MRLRDLSLRRTVPLYIGTGLLIVIVVWSWLAYQSARAAAQAVGEQRLAAVASQLATAYEATAHEFGRSMHGVATVHAITEFMRTGALQPNDTVRALLKRATTGANHRIAFFGVDGTPLASFPDTQHAASVERHEELTDEFVAARKGPDFAAVAPLRLLDDSVVMPVVASITIDSQPAGYVVLWRRTSMTAQQRGELPGLIGAQFYLGNARGDLWTDLSGGVHRLPAVSFGGAPARYSRGDTAVLATARRIEGTPWAVAVELDTKTIMAPADRFLQRSAIVGLVVLVLTIVAAGLLSRRFTTPLTALTDAATAMAAGDYTRRVDLDRRDELGRLATSFNGMATHVGESQRVLEDRVRERTHELEERNEELEAFARSVAHDLRAPLRAMHGFSQALLEDCSDQLDDTGKSYARRIAAAAQRMDLLTQDLLAYSRVSRTELSLSSLDLSAVAHDAIALLDSDIAARHARITVQEPLPRAFGHRPLLEQSVTNLVANALKFVTPDRVPEVQIRAERSNGIVRLWVEDNGIGIDPAHHERIFQVFERLHQADHYAGSGIGLAIVRKAVERMGGHAGVESTVGAGSRFWLELRAAEAVP